MVNLPPGSVPARVAANAKLEVFKHEIVADPKIAELLATVDAAPAVALTADQRASVAEMRREWRIA